jgi:hypothetical protein
MDIWEILSPMLETVLAGVASIAIGALSLYVRQWLLAQIGQQKLDAAVSITRAAVLAVEQEATKYGWDGEQKKAQALQTAQSWLDARGIELSVTELAQVIEAVVMEEFNKWAHVEAAGMG